MAIHLYLSLLPEALIASMLSPEDFGTYYAVGSAKKSRGQAMFLRSIRTSATLIFEWRKQSNDAFPTKMEV